MNKNRGNLLKALRFYSQQDSSINIKKNFYTRQISFGILNVKGTIDDPYLTWLN